jgi:hypothetical protein
MSSSKGLLDQNDVMVVISKKDQLEMQSQQTLTDGSYLSPDFNLLPPLPHRVI